ncbi:MAG TPA: stage III sporulation protein AA [Lachnospiraceae bacterium]|nr:stage III sporulation protein AA [Lachnospiraceae bacterium]
MTRRCEIEGLFPEYLRKMFSISCEYLQGLQEIRLRVNQPVILNINNYEFFLSEKGTVHKEKSKGFILLKKDLNAILSHICKYSIYAFEDEIKQGYLTVEGGHRIGLTGQVVLENECIKTIKNISFMNIRVSHEIVGVSDHIIPNLYSKHKFLNTLIISPPGAGKTTLLRDLIRNISDGTKYASGVNVGVVDERSEIGGSYLGTVWNNLGMRTDLLDACPKALGMIMLIRSMSPVIIAVDELGSLEDIKALHQIIQCGCSIVATIHGESLEEVREKEFLSSILKDKVFERYVVLSKKDKVGTVQGIYNKDFLWEPNIISQEG